MGFRPPGPDCYAKGMDNLPILCVKRLALLAAPRPFLREALPSVLTSLSPTVPVCVLDGGNNFNHLAVSRALRRITPDVEQRLNNIRVARAFTCYQVVSLLANAPVGGTVILALEMAATFYDESVNLYERKLLFNQCLDHLERLNQTAPVAVTFAIHPMAGPDEWLWQFEQRRTVEVYYLDFPPRPAQPRLFP